MVLILIQVRKEEPIRVKEESVERMKQDEEKSKDLSIRDACNESNNGCKKENCLEGNENNGEKSEDCSKMAEKPRVSPFGQVIAGNNCADQNFLDDDDLNDDERYSNFRLYSPSPPSFLPLLFFS